jgi:predicted secreted hydrolase
MLRSPAGGIFPFQVTFLRRELGGAPQEGAWSHTRFLTAQATLGSDQGRILSDARRARLGLPGQAQEDRLGLRCDGWSISDPGDGWLHVDIPLRGGRVRLNLALKGDPLSLPPLEPGDPLQRTLRTRLEAEGRLELEGRAPVPVSGRALLLQEWGPEVPAEVNGWDRAFLFLRDGRSLLYLGTRASQPSQTARPLLLEINAQGLPSVAHRPPAAKVLRFWSSPLSRTRYPVALQIQDPRQPLTFEPAADTQEWVGDWVGALTFWSGAGLLKNPQGAPIGEGFLELAGYAHPVQGRF